MLQVTNNSNFGTEEACISFDIHNLSALEPGFNNLSCNFVKMAWNPQTTNGVKTKLSNS